MSPSSSANGQAIAAYIAGAPQRVLPAEVADMCVYLLSDESRFVTGAEFVIDGGLTAR